MNAASTETYEKNDLPKAYSNPERFTQPISSYLIHGKGDSLYHVKETISQKQEETKTKNKILMPFFCFGNEKKFIICFWSATINPRDDSEDIL